MASLNICRCCLAEGLHKDLNLPYTFFDKKEIYSNMLLECFNIVLTPDTKCNGICDECIKSLRSSLSFKKQVLKADQDFFTWIRDRSKNVVEVKLEPIQESDGDESDNDFLCDTVVETSPKIGAKVKDTPKRRVKLVGKSQKLLDTERQWRDIKFQTMVNRLARIDEEMKLENKPESDDNSDDYMLGDSVNETPDKVKTEVKESSKRRAKAASKKQTESDEDKTLVNRLTGSLNSHEISNIAKDKNEIITKTRKSKVTIPKASSKVTLKWSKSGSYHKSKHKYNLQIILECSNATPFKNKSLLGYICGYCDNTYPDPIDLRTHTEAEHKEERLDFKTKFDMTEYNVKLDVTDLTCSLCNEKLDNLTNLKDHLMKTHNKTIYNDIKDHIVQFKLKKGDVYDCAMCSSTYETFKMLKQHMNKHYCNYTCVKCHSSFATKRSLSAHRTTHQEGSFKCDLCEKIFSSRAKKQYHEKTKHLGKRRVSNCPHCDVPFRSYYQRNQHLVKVHNSEAQYKCNVCSKAYVLKSLLMYHIKKSHLMERNCQCTECGLRFFSKKALKAHMVKHTGKKIFACEVCHKSYARKYTLREHMRIHNNDRRFKCELCSATFVQKCSLKSHLLSNHGISIAASDIASS